MNIVAYYSERVYAHGNDQNNPQQVRNYIFIFPFHCGFYFVLYYICKKINLYVYIISLSAYTEHSIAQNISQ